MRSVKTSGVIDRGHKGHCDHRSHAGNRPQALDSHVRARDRRDHPVRVRERLGDVAHHRQQGRHLREQPAGQPSRDDPAAELVRPPRGPAPAMLPQPGPNENDVARARSDRGIAHRQVSSPMALRLGQPMGGTVRPELTGIQESPGVPPIGLNLPGPRGMHRREVRVRDHDRVAQGLEAPGDPFTPGRGLDQDPGGWPAAPHVSEPLRLGADAAFHRLARLGEQTDLAFVLVQIDANIFHGWPPSRATLSPFLPWGSVCHHVELRVSRFISSTLRRPSWR